LKTAGQENTARSGGAKNKNGFSFGTVEIVAQENPQAVKKIGEVKLEQFLASGHGGELKNKRANGDAGRTSQNHEISLLVKLFKCI
jgi:hypothetical protein